MYILHCTHSGLEAVRGREIAERGGEGHDRESTVDEVALVHGTGGGLQDARADLAPVIVPPGEAAHAPEIGDGGLGQERGGEAVHAQGIAGEGVVPHLTIEDEHETATLLHPQFLVIDSYARYLLNSSHDLVYIAHVTVSWLTCKLSRLDLLEYLGSFSLVGGSPAPRSHGLGIRLRG